MKRISMSAATAVLLAWSVTLGAQSSSTATQNQSPSTPPQGAAAQSGSTTQENGTTRPQRRSRRNALSSEAANQPQEMTVTGCLQANDQSGASASNAAAGATTTRRAQANAIPTYILANAGQESSNQPSPQPRSVGTTGTAGTSGNVPSTSNPPSSSSGASLSGTKSGSYILQGLDMSRQVGQQVEITGTMMPAPKARRGRATGTSGTTAAETESMPRIRVTSARMISEHCSNQ